MVPPKRTTQITTHFLVISRHFAFQVMCKLGEIPRKQLKATGTKHAAPQRTGGAWLEARELSTVAAATMGVPLDGLWEPHREGACRLGDMGWNSAHSENNIIIFIYNILLH